MRKSATHLLVRGINSFTGPPVMNVGGAGKKYKHTMRSLLVEWGNKEGGYLHQKFAILHNRSFDDPNDAQALCAALDHSRADELDGDPDAPWLDNSPAWFTIAWQMYRADSDSVRAVIRSKGVPLLRKRLELSLSDAANWRPEDHGWGIDWRFLNGKTYHFLFLLSLLSIYHEPNVAELANLAARHPRFENGGDILKTLANWPDVFSCFQSDRLETRKVLELLSDPLPRGEVALGFLIFSNRLLREIGGGISHPFDTPNGLTLLQRLAIDDGDDKDIENPTAIFVVEALPFIKKHGKDILVAKLAKHPNKHVGLALHRMIEG